MPNIKPISDLRSYTKVLNEVMVGAPVFLTENGYGKYVILDMYEYNKKNSEVSLLQKLEEGEQSARDNDWLTTDEVEELLGLK